MYTVEGVRNAGSNLKTEDQTAICLWCISGVQAITNKHTNLYNQLDNDLLVHVPVHVPEYETTIFHENLLQLHSNRHIQVMCTHINSSTPEHGNSLLSHTIIITLSLRDMSSHTNYRTELYTFKTTSLKAQVYRYTHSTLTSIQHTHPLFLWTPGPV